MSKTYCPENDVGLSQYVFRYDPGDMIFDRHLNRYYLVLWAGYDYREDIRINRIKVNHYRFLDLQTGQTCEMLPEWIEPHRHSELLA